MEHRRSHPWAWEYNFVYLLIIIGTKHFPLKLKMSLVEIKQPPKKQMNSTCLMSLRLRLSLFQVCASYTFLYFFFFFLPNSAIQKHQYGLFCQGMLQYTAITQNVCLNYAYVRERLSNTGCYNRIPLKMQISAMFSRQSQTCSAVALSWTFCIEWKYVYFSFFFFFFSLSWWSQFTVSGWWKWMYFFYGPNKH